MDFIMAFHTCIWGTLILFEIFFVCVCVWEMETMSVSLTLSTCSMPSVHFMEWMQVPALEECIVYLQMVNARWECHLAASQGQRAEQEQLSIGRGRWASSCFCLPGHLKWLLSVTGSFVLWFAFLSLCQWLVWCFGDSVLIPSQAGGIPVGNYMHLSVYSRKSLTLGRQCQVYFCCCLF